MTDATFDKISHSEERLYGPSKLLMCGLPTAAHPRFNTLLQMIGLEGIPKVWVTTEQADTAIAELLDLPDESGAGIPSDLPRAIIVSGIAENELLQLMAACKKSGLTKTLWATLTPTSEQWTLSQLLSELAAERDAMEQRKETD